MFREGLAVIAMEGRNDSPNYGFIDKSGKIVISPQFMSAENFHEGLALVSDGKKYGYINTEGKYVINPQFEKAANFSEGLAAVMQESSWGYIDKKGKYVINPQFEKAQKFKHGVAAVSAGKNKYGFIDKKGKYVINPQFESAVLFEKNFSAVESSDKIGFIDGEGKYIVNPQFDNFNSGYEYYVRNNYYNTSGFIEEFFKRSGDNKFDGFGYGTTFRDILTSSAYSGAKEDNTYKASIRKSEYITDEISLSTVTFSFVDPVYEYKTVYTQVSRYYSYPSKQKEYKWSSRLGSMEYSFNLSGDAYSKGITVANAIKAHIESRYNVKMEKRENGYYINKSDKNFGFVISSSYYGVSLTVEFPEVDLIFEEEGDAEDW
jgi:hypothetical protein